VPLKVFAAPVELTSGGTIRVAISVGIEYPTSVHAADQQDELTFRTLAVDHDGKTIHVLPRRFRIGASNASAAHVVNQLMELPARPHTVRVGISSALLGRTGTVHVPVSVPNFRQARIALSPVVLGVKDNRGASDFDRIAAVVPFQPVTRRQFSPAEELEIFSRVYWDRQQGGSLSASLTISEHSLVRAFKEGSIVGAAQGSRFTGVFRGAIPLSALAPGEYSLELTVRSTSRESARAALRFQITEASARQARASPEAPSGVHISVRAPQCPNCE
jgi:hypothetical protein